MEYRWTSLYARDRDSKNRLAYNEFTYKKTYDYNKFENRFQKKANFSFAYMRNREIADKKTAYNEGCLYKVLNKILYTVFLFT